MCGKENHAKSGEVVDDFGDRVASEPVISTPSAPTIVSASTSTAPTTVTAYIPGFLG